MLKIIIEDFIETKRPRSEDLNTNLNTIYSYLSRKIRFIVL